MLLSRIPCGVLDALEAENSRSDGRLLDLYRRQPGNITQVLQAEVGRAGETGRCGTKAKIVTFFANGRAVKGDFETEETAVGQAGLHDRMAPFFLLADVNVNFTGHVVVDYASCA